VCVLQGWLSADAIDDAIDLIHRWTEMDVLNETIKLCRAAETARVATLN
jgi:hypothetical protein